jgi:mevalonate kinase
VTVVVEAPGKLVLLGEYAVLEGAPGLVTAVGRRARVELDAASTPVVAAPNLGIAGAAYSVRAGEVRWGSDVPDDQRDALGFVAVFIERALQAAGAELAPPALRIDSSAFSAGGHKLGVGSSAAVAAATTAAVLLAGGAANDESLHGRTLELALSAHSAAQAGSGSGIDVAASVLGGLLHYERPPGGGAPVYWRLAPPAWLDPICVWTGRAASTRRRVAQVRAFGERQPRAYRVLMDEMHGVAEMGCEAIAGDDPARFFDAVAEYGEALARLGADSGAEILSAEHRRVHEVVRAEGGVYKPSGAGGGDLGVAFAESAAATRRVEEAVARAGFEIVRLQIAAPGLVARTP